MARSGWIRMVCALALGNAAWAHAVLLECTPSAGATVTGPVVALSLRFNSRVDGNRSRVTAACAGVAEAVVALAAQGAPDRISGELKGLPPGNCRVRWQVLATDGHITRGEFSFRKQ